MVAQPARSCLRWGGRAATLAAAGLLVAGCATGLRPRLAPELSTTGVAEVDAVLLRLGTLGSAVYSASYSVYRSPGDTPTEVTTTQSAADRRSLTIGDVRYIVNGGTPQTCRLSTGQCEAGLDSARVSDVRMNHDFFGTHLMARLRSDAATASGPTTSSVVPAHGKDATCITIPLPAPASAPSSDPASMYCVLETGVLTALEAPDVRVELMSYSDVPDEAQFEKAG
jgi:hypothetical protein